MWGVGTPEERAEMALRIKGQGWRAMKLRSSFGTLRDDVRLVERVRRAVGGTVATRLPARPAG